MAGEQEPSQQERSPTQRALGLATLDSFDRRSLEAFIDVYAPWLQGQFRDEETALHDHVAFEPKPLDVLALAAGDEEERDIAAGVIAEYAAQHPQTGFAIWVGLMKDASGTVFGSAERSLLYALGRMDLDPRGVLGVIAAYYARREAHGDRHVRP
jgi:hypothetical protein